jgi:hypothetical protein
MKFLLLFFALFLIAQPIFSQAVIYRKNGEIISAYNLAIAGKTRSYNLPDDAEGIKRYISITTIDSIKYEDGSKDVFPSYGLIERVRKEELESFNRLLLGIDVAAITFYNNLKVSFEYLPGNGFIGLYTSFSINTDPRRRSIYEGYEDYYDFNVNIMKTLHWNGRAGINGYIFPPGSFRISSGLHWITGKYVEELIVDLQQPPWSATKSITDKSFNGLLFSPALNWQPISYLRITAAIDLGIYTNPEVTNKSIFRTELLLNF